MVKNEYFVSIVAGIILATILYIIIGKQKTVIYEKQ